MRPRSDVSNRRAPKDRNETVALRRPTLIKLLAPLLAFAVTALGDRCSQPLLRPHRRRPAPAAPAASPAPAAPPTSASARSRRPSREPAKNASGLRVARQRLPPEGAGRAATRATTQRAEARVSSRRLSRTRATPARSPAWGRWRSRVTTSRQAFATGGRRSRGRPGVARIYGVIVDAQVELGRYGEAERSLQRMVDLKPNLSSYARVSYFRELHGDLDGALEAMRLAVSAGGDGAENVAYVQTLLGNLEFERGNVSAPHGAPTARRSRASAGYAAARSGARAGSRPPAATSAWRDPPLPARWSRGCRCPSTWSRSARRSWPQAARAAARRAFRARGERSSGCLPRNGVNTDAELGAVRGQPRQIASRAVEARPARLGGRARACARPTRSAGRSPAPAEPEARPRVGRSGRCGSARADPIFLYHAGIAARDAGREQLARSYLTPSARGQPPLLPAPRPASEGR